jgi:beta-lactamase class A
MINRRMLLGAAAGAGLLAAIPAGAKKTRVYGSPRLTAAIAALEGESGGRLGVALTDTGSGAHFGWRGAERFAMCSTFKFLLAAATLNRADRGLERLDRTVPIVQSDILANSPATEKLVGKGATVAALCQATLQLSDNAAANLLLVPLGGPAGFTRFLRAAGDPVTRLDRTEPMMNLSAPGDPRDTTTPEAMNGDIGRFLLGHVLKPASRAQLNAWMVANKTGDNRIRAGTPSGWIVADKTGTSGKGNFNDLALLRPPGRAPILLSLYLAESKLESAASEAILARATRALLAEL